jgi:hypothetical protein
MGRKIYRRESSTRPYLPGNAGGPPVDREEVTPDPHGNREQRRAAARRGRTVRDKPEAADGD